MKITKKSQLTIRCDIRKKVERLPNLEVELEASRERTTVTRVLGAPNVGRSIVEALRGSAGITRKGMTTDELMVFTRGEI